MIKTSTQIEEIRKMALVVSELLQYSLEQVQAGMTTFELDLIIERKMEQLGVTGPCKGYHGYPAVSCLSVNDQVTHGIPDQTMLREGDIIDVDLVIERDGYYADVSRTIGIGPISEEARRLIHVTEECLQVGIKAVAPGSTLGDVGHAIQTHAEKNGYSVVRDYSGHFIGLAMHEEPLVPNFGKKRKGPVLKPGMVFCIEPMINAGNYQVLTMGWDARTMDHSLSSRCEHMVLVTADGHEVLTDW